MTSSARRGEEAGFTLIELLAVIAILGVISFALTEALILGFKTTDGTIADVSRSAGIQVLEPYFTRDAQSAEVVTSTDSTCASGPVFLNLRWSEQGGTRTVSYALDPPTGGEHELVRWSCSGGGAADRRVLGHFTHDPAGPSPVTASCDEALVCPATPDLTAPSTITLSIQTDPSASPAAATKLTVRRRTT